ncbi:MAG: signal peptide peptidase SppA [Phycisphaerae bacterium]
MQMRTRWLGMSVLGAVIALPGQAAPVMDTDMVAQVVVVRLKGEIPEAPPEFDFFELEPSRSLHSILEKFRKMKKDDKVKAVVLTFDKPEMGWAQMQELRHAISDLRAADKDVYCYLEEASTGIYQLATAATRISMTPTGELRLVGLYVEQAYFKGLLDKIKVEADIEHVGAYKGAGEPFTQTHPSPEAQEMMNWLVKDLFEQMVDTIAEGRQIPADQVRELIDKGPFTAQEAKEAKLIDETSYVGDFLSSLKKRYGEDLKLVFNYGAKKGPDIDFSNPFAIFKIFGEAMQKARAAPKQSIGVVYVEGMIVPGETERSLFGSSGMVGSSTLRKVLTKAREDDSIKALVLRVDSPGGSAVASDIIWHAARELGEEKPLVVSMGNIAASGGYYVSAGAATIFADPATLTGSIGVVGGKIVTKGLWDWLGISFHETQIGENADLYTTNRRFDEREREIIRKYMKTVYNEFTDRVKKGRGERLKKDLDELAGGRVFTGKQALANGLVDKLGGLQDAIKFAAAGANLSDYEVKLLPERKNFFDLLLKSLTGEELEDDGLTLRAAGIEGAARLGWTLQTPGVREILPALRALDPQKTRTVLRSLLRIELLGHEGTLLVVPGELTIRDGAAR